MVKSEEPILNFTCPICNEEVDANIDDTDTDEDLIDITFDEDKQQFYHISCVNKK